MSPQFRCWPASTIFCAAILTACGGGGSAGAVSSYFSGTVVDGYIQGATVCLDLNANQACDASEPSDISKADGTYRLDVTAVALSALKSAHVLTVVPLTAKDSDDSGQSLQEAGKLAFHLMAPASAFVSSDGVTLLPAVVSPLTTLVSSDLLLNPGKSLTEAEQTVRTQLGLAQATDLKQDVVKLSGNAPLRLRAQAIAKAMGQALSELGESREAKLAALAYVAEKSGSLRDPAAVWVSQDVADRRSTLLVEAQKYTQSTSSDAASILAAGVYGHTCMFTGCEVGALSAIQYSKIQSINGQWFRSDYQATALGWNAVTPDANTHYLTSQKWVPAVSRGTLRFDANGAVVFDQTGSAHQFIPKTFDLSGKKPSDYLGLGLDAQVLSLLGELVFRAGSQAYWLPTYALTDSYRIRVSDDSLVSVNGQPVTALAEATSDTTAERKVVHGENLLITHTAYLGGKLMYALYDGKVYKGVYQPMGYVEPGLVVFNRTAFDDILSQVMLPKTKID